MFSNLVSVNRSIVDCHRKNLLRQIVSELFKYAEGVARPHGCITTLKKICLAPNTQHLLFPSTIVKLLFSKLSLIHSLTVCIDCSCGFACAERSQLHKLFMQQLKPHILQFSSLQQSSTVITECTHNETVSTANRQLVSLCQKIHFWKMLSATLNSEPMTLECHQCYMDFVMNNCQKFHENKSIYSRDRSGNASKVLI